MRLIAPLLAAAASSLMLMGCTPTAPAAPTAPEADAKAADACADGGAKLASLDMCQSDAAKLLVISGGREPALPEGCTWAVQETVMPNDGGVMLYRSASCNGVTTTLVAEGSGESVNYNYKSSAIFPMPDGIDDDMPIAELDVAGPDPKVDILGQVVLLAETENERTNCEIRAAGNDSWPADALVADLNAAAKELGGITDDEVRQACGYLGLDTGESKFWLVRQGRAFFVQQGQDESDIDARSITVVAKSADGAWAVAPAPPVPERN